MKNWNWFAFALSSAVLMTIVILIVKRGLNEGISSLLWLMYFYGFNAILIAAYLKSKKSIKRISKFLLKLLIIAAILGVLANFALTQAIRISPNPGYVSAITSTQILLVSIASIFLFKSEFTFKKGLGTILVVIGIILFGL